MSSALILDPWQNFPSASLFFEKSDYCTAWHVCSFPLTGKPIFQPPSFFKDRYGLEVCPLSKLQKKYDILCLVMDLPFVNRDSSSMWGGRDPVVNKKIHDVWGDILLKVRHIKYKKLIIIDHSDFPLCSRGISFFEKDYEKKVDVVFKREYRYTCTFDYDKRVVPFPFVMFGVIDPTWLLYKEKKSYDDVFQRPPVCVWGSNVVIRVGYDDFFRFSNRYDFMNEIFKHPEGENLLFPVSDVPLESFQEVFKEGRFALHLNGSGHLCKVFFEGLASGVLLLQQEMQIVFPFEDKFAPETIFSDTEQFLFNYKKLTNNPSLYQQALSQQHRLVNKYFRPEWISNYIHSKL